MTESKLSLVFSVALKKRNGKLYDDSDTIIPDETIAKLDKNYMMFRDGWRLIVKDDVIEIQYPHLTLLFSEGRIKKIVINYQSRL